MTGHAFIASEDNEALRDWIVRDCLVSAHRALRTISRPDDAIDAVNRLADARQGGDVFSTARKHGIALTAPVAAIIFDQLLG